MFHLISLAQLDITPLNNNKTYFLKSDMGPFSGRDNISKQHKSFSVFFNFSKKKIMRNKNCSVGKAHKWQGTGRTLARTGVIT